MSTEPSNSILQELSVTVDGDCNITAVRYGDRPTQHQPTGYLDKNPWTGTVSGIVRHDVFHYDSEARSLRCYHTPNCFYVCGICAEDQGCEILFDREGAFKSLRIGDNVLTDFDANLGEKPLEGRLSRATGFDIIFMTDPQGRRCVIVQNHNGAYYTNP